MHTAPVATVFGEAARSGLVSGSVHTRSVAKALGSGTGIRSLMLALTPEQSVVVSLYFCDKVDDGWAK